MGDEDGDDDLWDDDENGNWKSQGERDGGKMRMMMDDGDEGEWEEGGWG